MVQDRWVHMETCVPPALGKGVKYMSKAGKSRFLYRQEIITTLICFISYPMGIFKGYPLADSQNLLQLKVKHEEED